jgi:hypothetical protein
MKEKHSMVMKELMAKYKEPELSDVLAKETASYEANVEKTNASFTADMDKIKGNAPERVLPMCNCPDDFM